MAFIGPANVVASYDPGLVFVHIGFPFSIEVRGLANVPGAVRISSDARWTDERGCDGEVIRRRQRGRSGALQLILMQTSAELDLLMAARVLDQSTGLGFFPLAVVDANGTGNRVSWAERAWLTGPPAELDLSPLPTALVYTFRLDGLEVVIGSLRRVN